MNKALMCSVYTGGGSENAQQSDGKALVEVSIINVLIINGGYQCPW